MIRAGEKKMTKKWHYFFTGGTFTVEPRVNEPWPGFDFEVARKVSLQQRLKRVATIANELGVGPGELQIAFLDDEVIDPTLTFPAKRGNICVHFLLFGEEANEDKVSVTSDDAVPK